MSEFTIDEYDTQKTVFVTQSIRKLADKVDELREDGLSNYRISEYEILDDKEYHILTMNLDEFDSISYLRSTI